MYHKSIVHSQIWRLVLPIFFIVFFFFLLFSFLFYQIEKDREFSNHKERLIFLGKEIDHYFQDLNSLFFFLEDTISLGREEKKININSMEDSSLFYTLSFIEANYNLREDFDFIFFMDKEDDIILVDLGEDTLIKRKEPSLSSFIGHDNWAFQTDEEGFFNLSTRVNFSIKDEPLFFNILFSRIYKDPVTGEPLFSYGVGVSASKILATFLDSLDIINEIIFYDPTNDSFLMGGSLRNFFKSNSVLHNNFFNSLILPKRGISDYQNAVNFYLSYLNSYTSFYTLEVPFFQKPFFSLIGLKSLSYRDYLLELITPLFIFTLLSFLLIFTTSYFYMESFIYKPIGRLTDHIINLSSSNNFLLEAPGEGAKDEILYLFDQFRYFQKKLTFLLLEIKDLQAKNIAIQETVFKKSGKIYFESKDVLEYSFKLENDHLFLKQFLDKFLEQFNLLFNLSEESFTSLTRNLILKDKLLDSWSNFSQITIKGDCFLSLPEIRQNRIKESFDSLDYFLKSLFSDLSKSQEVFNLFNSQRLELTHTFFEVKENINFLMGTTRETVSFLSRFHKEVEDLYFIQTQEQQKNREKIEKVLSRI